MICRGYSHHDFSSATLPLDMNLSPPSLTTSPASSRQEYPASPSSTFGCCNSLESSRTGHSPHSVQAFHHFYSLPNSSLDQSSVPELVKESCSLFPPISMSQPLWSDPEVIAAAFATSTPLTAPNLVPADYNHLAENEPFPEPYTAQGEPGGYNAPLLDREIPSSGASTVFVDSDRTRIPYSLPTRDLLGHSPSYLPSQTQGSGVTPYRAGIQIPYNHYPYSTDSSLQTVYNTQDFNFSGITGQPCLVDNHVAKWDKQDMDIDETYGTPASYSPSPSQDALPSSSSVARARRQPRKHTTKEDANFECDVPGCGKFFSRSYNYKSHLETHDDKREYPFQCPLEGCNKKFVRKTDLQRHHQSVHMKERNHKCDYCGRFFARKDTLRR